MTSNRHDETKTYTLNDLIITVGLSLPFKSELIQFHREREDICYISGLMLSQGSVDYAMISHFRCIPAEIASFYFRDVI